MKAGIQITSLKKAFWIPACTGMTVIQVPFPPEAPGQSRSHFLYLFVGPDPTHSLQPNMFKFLYIFNKTIVKYAITNYFMVVFACSIFATIQPQCFKTSQKQVKNFKLGMLCAF